MNLGIRILMKPCDANTNRPAPESGVAPRFCEVSKTGSEIFRKHFASLLAALGVIVGSFSFAQGADQVPGELLIKFNPAATDTQIGNALRKARLKVRRHQQTQAMKERGHNGITVVTSDLRTKDAIALIQNDPAVDYVEPNYVYKHQAVSNDPYVTGNNTWGLYSATSTPANSFGSGAIEAWAGNYIGSTNVYVAVIDEGIDIENPEISPNIWRNPHDPLDGIDNDGNGYIDDLHGWNFFGDDNRVIASGNESHGTHVSGTIGAKGGNGNGIAGVNWNITILSGKFLGPNGGDTASAVEAIDYFVDLKARHGLNIVAINASWGGGGDSRTLQESIIRAVKAGIIFCAAAGNDGLNNDVNASYPANYDTTIGTTTETAASFNGVISVAAIDSNGALASFSNYGQNKVHIGAPGVQILSTVLNNGLAYMNGTSMAAPHVTGAIALYASANPGASAQTIRNAILAAASSTPSLLGKTTTGGRLNIAAIPFAPIPVLPSPSVALATPLNSSQIQIGWTDNSTDETGFKVFRKPSGGSYTQVATVSANAISYTDIGLAGGAQYTYKVCATGVAGDSTFSNETTTTTAPYAPINLAVANDPTGQVQFTWKDNSVNETGFKVFRRVAGGVHSQIGATAKNVIGWVDGTGTPGVRYYYTVSASGPVIDSGFFTEVSIIAGLPTAPSSLAVTPLNSSQIDLTWTDNSGNETGFKIFRAKGTGSYSLVTTVAPGTTGYRDSGLAGGTQYSYKLVATNGAGDSAFSNSSSTATAPYAPIQLAVTALSPTEVEFRWKDNSANETGFKVFRRIPGGAYSQIATVAPNTILWLDATATPGARYYYTVCASGVVIDSGFFTEVSVTMPAAL